MRSRFYLLVTLVPVLIFGLACGRVHLKKAATFAAYEPQAGDVVMQSLPRNELVRAIEVVTNSPYSHCGIVVKRHDEWQVLEAIGPVRYTPLARYLDRGRGDAFAVYRLRTPHQRHVPGMIDEAAKMLGRPYDFRYRLDDDWIYCSELIYKGFLAASGEELGQLESMGSLNWQPYEKTIRKYDGGGLPLERLMITPVGLSRATQLERVLVSGYAE